MNEQTGLLHEINSAIWVLIYLVSIGLAFNIIRSVLSSYRIIKSELENVFYNTTSALFENGDYDEVIEHCNKHLEKKPNEAYGYWFLGKTFFQKKRYDEAAIYFKKAIEIHPSWEEKWVSPYLKKIEAVKNTVNNSSNLIGEKDAPRG